MPSSKRCGNKLRLWPINVQSGLIACQGIARYGSSTFPLSDIDSACNNSLWLLLFPTGLTNGMPVILMCDWFHGKPSLGWLVGVWPLIPSTEPSCYICLRFSQAGSPPSTTTTWSSTRSTTLGWRGWGRTPWRTRRGWPDWAGRLRDRDGPTTSSASIPAWWSAWPGPSKLSARPTPLPASGSASRTTEPHLAPCEAQVAVSMSQILGIMRSCAAETSLHQSAKDSCPAWDSITLAVQVFRGSPATPTHTTGLPPHRRTCTATRRQRRPVPTPIWAACLGKRGPATARWAAGGKCRRPRPTRTPRLTCGLGLDPYS